VSGWSLLVEPVDILIDIRPKQRAGLVIFSVTFDAFEVGA
jgi:hypothetical protein